jgi:hypothetical protein
MAFLAMAAVVVAPAMTVVSSYISSHPQIGVDGQPDLVAFAWRVGIPAAIMAAPVALVLSIVAMSIRAGCQEPKPKLPVIALTLSLVLVGLIAWVLIFFWSLGQMH